MARALHVIDETTPPDALMQLSLLAAPEDGVVAIGPPPHGCAPPKAPSQVHCPFRVARLAGQRLRRRAGEADVIHAWSPRSAEAAIACYAGGPVVLSLTITPGGRALKRLIRRLSKGRLTCSTPTDLGRRQLLTAGAPMEAVHVLPPPASPIPDAAGRRRLARESLGIADDATLLVAPGPLVRDGGARTAMWVHGICRHAGCPVHLAIPRGGPFEQHVRYFATTAAFSEEIHFTDGRMPVEDVLSAADVALVLPRADVGVSAVAEALAAGLATVASDLPPLAECIAEGRSGLLCTPGDVRASAAAVLRLIEDADLADRLRGGAAAAGQQNHDPAACRRLLDDLYGAATRGERLERTFHREL